ncbi:RnfABCDGE type electron transport complex subunit B [Thiospirochaeta perfilievii]|uniref:Ion-translocating oxidoreductase complex subunit B n=1 Tax=Thiospirochaeta perfilievii TaxID=252967 RepID=A0A5C1Q8I3_9SPIO|nr:RnfABCDGE type electron transport complex subunit B [Thiospirochaeta perfilievii]QEN03801.1 RnfABCDGE type electron transport complex subunit B [Thiospirochaeta perfilievii]
MLNILIAIVSIGFIGGILGAVLSLASDKLKVEEDLRVKNLEEILPQYNCGACGYSGCSGYANAVINSGEAINKCTPGGPDLLDKISAQLGVKTDGVKRMVAQVHCRGGQGTSKDQFKYDGIGDCNAKYQLYSGDKLCKFGCLGDGSCMAVCPVDAIYRDEENLIWVDKNKCVGCEKCVDICPTNVIKMIPYSADYIVACSSQEKGKAVKSKCSVGCIACSICVRKFPEAGFVVDKNLSSVDYTIDSDRTEVEKACPVKCIIHPYKEKKGNI